MQKSGRIATFQERNLKDCLREKVAKMAATVPIAARCFYQEKCAKKLYRTDSVFCGEKEVKR